MKNLSFFFLSSLAMCCALTTSDALAHNGNTALAYPLKNIRIDGDISEWGTAKRYALLTTVSDTRPGNADDFSGFFMIGYGVSDRSLYVAIEIIDSEFISDTTKYVQWNSQDAVELYLDISHLKDGSGVASYLYSETLRHINANKWDAASRGAAWDKVEVKMKRVGNKRTYEWKFNVGDALLAGRSIGFDMMGFDKDADGFTFNAWGGGERKFQNAKALGDILLVKENEPTGTATGKVNMTAGDKRKFPTTVMFTSATSPNMFTTVLADSLGTYSVTLPQGAYSVALSEKYIPNDDKIFIVSLPPPVNVNVKFNSRVSVPAINATVTEAPDLLPAKGVLQNFSVQSSGVIDNFIETYQKYYKIPGVSLALIKDGKVVYHKAYGAKNSISKEPVNDSTLYEAASITKPVFSYAVQRLAERGLIDLDKPLYTYLPFKDIEYDDRYKLITGRHVLTHRTGFPNWRDGKLVINFTPGTQFGYSGEGMQYLQAVIEKITGKNIEQVLKEEVLDPLGMSHTFFSNNERLKRLVAIGHYDNIPSYDEPPSHAGMAYSMHTEALEFTKFMLQLLNQKGLSAKTYANMLSEGSPATYEEGEKRPKYKEYMGESLGVRDSPYGLAFGHSGNNGDFLCLFEVYKDSRMGYVIFTNSSTANPLIGKMKEFFVEGKEQ